MSQSTKKTMYKIDLIQNNARASILSHWTRDGVKTLCGRVIKLSQTYCENGMCKQCEKLAAKVGIEPQAT